MNQPLRAGKDARRAARIVRWLVFFSSLVARAKLVSNHDARRRELIIQKGITAFAAGEKARGGGVKHIVSFVWRTRACASTT